jgi:hypothetical protein
MTDARPGPSVRRDTLDEDRVRIMIPVTSEATGQRQPGALIITASRDGQITARLGRWEERHAESTGQRES